MIEHQRLRTLNLLADLGEEQLARMANSATRREVDRDQILFQHGDDARYFYLIEKGRIKLSRLAPNGQEKIIEILRTGQTFAEAVMFFKIPRYPVDATALEPTSLLGLDGRVFMDILRESPDTSITLLGTLSMRLHQRVNEIDALALQNSALRVINYLLQNIEDGAQTSTVELEATKKLIAARLSIQPETFSRALKQLTQRGAIAVRGSSIEVLNIELLRRLAIDL